MAASIQPAIVLIQADLVEPPNHLMLVASITSPSLLNTATLSVKNKTRGKTVDRFPKDGATQMQLEMREEDFYGGHQMQIR
jgi:hypothetical protein